MPPRTTLRARPRLPLALTGDPDLLEHLLRLAAAGGVELEVAPDPAAARPRYATAPLVLIGADQALACLRARLPRRDRVVLVGQTGADGPPWEMAEQIGAQHVAMLPAAEPWLVDRFTEAPGDDPGARTVAVIGGRGGAGASVLAVGLAVTASRTGRRALLLDADPLGGGVDLLLGWEDVDGPRWPALHEAGGIDAPALVRALPGGGDLAVLSFDRGRLLAVPAEAMAAALDAGRSGRDLVVVDVPRHVDDAAAVALASADRTLLVVPAELRATAAASRVVAAVSEYCRDLAVVVRGPAPGQLDGRDVAEALGLPLAGTLRPESGLSGALERGEAPASRDRGPLATLCQRLVADLVATTGSAAA